MLKAWKACLWQNCLVCCTVQTVTYCDCILFKDSLNVGSQITAPSTPYLGPLFEPISAALGGLGLVNGHLGAVIGLFQSAIISGLSLWMSDFSKWFVALIQGVSAIIVSVHGYRDWFQYSVRVRLQTRTLFNQWYVRYQHGG